MSCNLLPFFGCNLQPRYHCNNYCISYLILSFQVLDWLQNHGEVFLRKNVGIGRNLQKARAYQKSHETFEGVVQVRRRNLNKEREKNCDDQIFKFSRESMQICVQTFLSGKGFQENSYFLRFFY